MGLAERLILLLELREQPYVLDRDDGLVGEGLQQVDMPVGEAADFIPEDDDDTDRRDIAQHRHRQDASPAASEDKLARNMGVSERVLELHDRSSEDRSTRDQFDSWRCREHLLQDL